MRRVCRSLGGVLTGGRCRSVLAHHVDQLQRRPTIPLLTSFPLFLRCVHFYHKPCIDLWIRRQALSATCPLCKRGLVPQPRQNACATRGAGSSRRQRTLERSGVSAATAAAAVEEGSVAGSTLASTTPADSSQAQLEPLLAIEAAADDDLRGGGRRPAEQQQDERLSSIHMANEAHHLQPRSLAPQQQRPLSSITDPQVEEPSTLTTRLLPPSSG
mmetsp:Transcript_7847/g.25105  ORF Transcript_7847/g.25105 Transcript_7847/m.25105 type:complete len:215 (+) Transcript_7847:749-1393(+)|eukprot:scaffold3639_cov141-Isochrysis_galbana.AAC.5